MHIFKPTRMNPLTEAHETRSLRITAAEAAEIVSQVGKRSGEDNGTAWWDLQVVSNASFAEPRCTLTVDKWGTCCLAAQVGDIPAICAALGELLRADMIVVDVPMAA